MTLWNKVTPALPSVTAFTTGNDRIMDMYLARFDVLGSLAHVRMIESIGLLTKDELKAIMDELKNIYHLIEKGSFQMEDGVEDIHSQIELLLTRSLGDAGKKIHSGRSRNDQVLLDIKLFIRREIQLVAEAVKELFDLLILKSEKHKGDLLPGYTHLQLAMPSSFGLWFGAYAESLADDMISLQSAYRMANKNPLGSGAGYGSSFPLNRKMTSDLLGFEDLNYNVVYAQMGRGKTEKIVSAAMGNVASTLSKLSMDACLYMNQNFGFIKFADELTTGSSIMPHKKNPDVFELIRAKCNSIQALSYEIGLMTTNLPSGYHRDLQLLKEKLFPAFLTLRECLGMMHLMLSNIQVKENILQDVQYQFLFSVEEVNKLVLQGIPFRDAYKRIGKDIENGTFKYASELKHTHEGSMGNLCNDQISAMMENHLNAFNFDKAQGALARLIN